MLVLTSNSAISFLSAALAATVAFFGVSFTTDAFFAKPNVAKVYLRYSTFPEIPVKHYLVM
jgi:hypothetical protein